MPVRSVPSCSPCATLLATDLVKDPAPSVEITVILSMARIGSDAAATICGNIFTSRSSTAASLKWAKASALRCSASASDCPFARMAAASAWPSRCASIAGAR